MTFAIAEEILLTKPYTAEEVIDTVYFGGGTPSLLQLDELQILFSALGGHFSLSPGAEITFEVNPDDVNSTALQNWRGIGINRLSLGVQSFQDDELKWMNRAHNAGDSRSSINAIREAGFNNFSVDLIYGSPLLSDESLRDNLRYIIAESVPHLSCYALTVEPKTALNFLVETKKSLPVDSEKQARQFLIVMDMLTQAGYEHYEISNFALPGFRSKHNSSYWKGKAYYGFGPGAHSFDGIKTRRWNVANNPLYLRSLQNGMIPLEEEVLTPTQQLNEYIMTSLRTSEGLDLNLADEKHGGTSKADILSAAQKFLSTNKLKIEDDHLILTNEGKLFADGIAAELFF